ncbi:hypothetical protein [Bhargavaea beijingensis]|nr:hypothetical protein [Bhargavaea beijingensis]MCW1928851.1 hypothetical protein [Bhargavaea beijingensis]
METIPDVPLITVVILACLLRHGEVISFSQHVNDKLKVTNFEK